MNNKCPTCGHKIPLFSPEEIVCAGCGEELTCKNKSLVYAAICVIGYLPAKMILSMSFTLGTFLQALGVIVGLWFLYIVLKLMLTTYSVKESTESNE